MYYAWYYNDHSTGRCYYVRSHEMSVTEFAREVSKVIGRIISASDTSAAYRQSDLDKHHAVHL